MTGIAHGGEGQRASRLRPALWGLAALLVAAPLVIMQFTKEMNWGGEDFLFAAVVAGLVGGAAELAVRMSRDTFYRAGAACAIAAAFAIVWASAAVGMIGDGDNNFSLMFVGVIGLAVGGSALAKFRASGTALAMAAAGVVQVAVALAGYAIDPNGAVISAVLAGLWFAAAALFRAAGKRGAR